MNSGMVGTCRRQGSKRLSEITYKEQENDLDQGTYGKSKDVLTELSVVVHTCNLSTGKAEAGGSPAVQGQPGGRGEGEREGN